MFYWVLFFYFIEGQLFMSTWKENRILAWKWNKFEANSQISSVIICRDQLSSGMPVDFTLDKRNWGIAYVVAPL